MLSAFIGYTIFGLIYLVMIVVFYVFIYWFVICVVFGTVFYEYFLFTFNLNRWGVFYWALYS